MSRLVHTNDPGPGTVNSVLADAARDLKLERGHHVEPFKIGNVELEAHGDRAIILEDEFRSGYECPTCNGTGKAHCPNCNGSGINRFGSKCNFCPESSGKIMCPACGGKGGLLVVPDNAQRRPTTGTIMSIGPGVWQNGVWIPTTFKVGESVMYSNFAGYALDIDDKVVRILHEVEIFCHLRGHLTLRTVREMPDSQDSLNNSMLDRGRT